MHCNELKGKGKIFVAAHDSYLNWLHECNRTQVTSHFIRNLKAWLCGDADLLDSQIIKLDELVNSGKGFSNYKIIEWQHEYDAPEQIQLLLIEYVRNGGALMIASCPWGYLDIYEEKNLKDMVLYNFLKNFTGIVFTSRWLELPEEIDVADNHAKFSHFDLAIQKIALNPRKIGKYIDTIKNGLESLEEVFTTDKLKEFKYEFISKLKKLKWKFIPKNDQPLKNQKEKYAAKLLSYLYSFNGLFILNNILCGKQRTDQIFLF